MAKGHIPGTPKTGGRVAGTPNRVTTGLQDLADKLGINPFELLLRFAANDWQALGYTSRTHSVPTKSGEVIEIDNIEPSERIQAAKSACEYLFPKRKAIEHTGANGSELFQSFGDFVKVVLAKDDGSK